MFTFIALIGWMVMIFCLSAQSAIESSQTSGELIKNVLVVIFPDFAELSAEEQLSLCEDLQFLVRKAAHFTIYFILGFLSFLNVITYKSISLSVRTWASSVFCLLYSISDEIHQLFVVGRSGEVRDVLIDFCGALMGILILRLFTKNGEQRRNVMRKNELIKLNNELFLNAEKYKAECDKLKNELKDKEMEIERLKLSLEAFEKKEKEPSPIKDLEQKIIKQASLSEEAKYGAAAIGKIVIKATSCCNSLTAAVNEDNKELVNLILGRTEVAKAEILKAVDTEMSLESKFSLIDTCRTSAEDYFLSVMAQRDWKIT